MTPEEVLKSAVSPVILALLALLVGPWLAARWNVWQKRRELALNSTKEFYKSYGEFFAIWKLWDYSVDALRDVCSPETRWQLLQRIAAAEAQVESLFVQLAAERPLTSVDCKDIGKFRQIFQTLREAIRHNRKLDWAGSEDPRYLAFKALSCRVAHLIATSHESKGPLKEDAWRSLHDITENQGKQEDWSTGWWTESQSDGKK